MEAKYRKEYVSVKAQFAADGMVMPENITWIDDVEYPIDRVLDVKKAASRKVGGHGILYMVSIRGNVTCLFREEDRWFVEAKYWEEG